MNVGGYKKVQPKVVWGVGFAPNKLTSFLRSRSKVKSFVRRYSGQESKAPAGGGGYDLPELENEDSDNSSIGQQQSQ